MKRKWYHRLILGGLTLAAAALVACSDSGESEKRAFLKVRPLFPKAQTKAAAAGKKAGTAAEKKPLRQPRLKKYRLMKRIFPTKD